MSQCSRHRKVALCLSLCPGWGHVYWGREAPGLVVFTVAAIFGFVFLNALLIYQGEGRTILVWISGSLMLVTFLAVWVDLFLRTSPARLRREQEAQERFLHKGTVAYLKDDLDDALVLFRECLRIDSQDSEALFRLGVIYLRRSERQLAAPRTDSDSEGVAHKDALKEDLQTGARNCACARRYLLKALRCDLDEKWNWEITREINRLRSFSSRSTDEKETREKEAEPTSI